jgi:hypothetical protein
MKELMIGNFDGISVGVTDATTVGRTEEYGITAGGFDIIPLIGSSLGKSFRNLNGLSVTEIDGSILDFRLGEITIGRVVEKSLG